MGGDLRLLIHAVMLIWLWILAVRHFQKSPQSWLLSSCFICLLQTSYHTTPGIFISVSIAEQLPAPGSMNTISSILNHFKYVVSFTHICWPWVLCENACGNNADHHLQTDSDCIAVVPLPHLLTREALMSTALEKLQLHLLLAFHL
jgi:hypothetical protein